MIAIRLIFLPWKRRSRPTRPAGPWSQAVARERVSARAAAPENAAAWTQIPTEIASGGLTRAAGTYASTGDGAWTITVTFTSTTDHTDVQLTGLQWASSGDNNLLASDVFTPVTLGNGDQLTVEWSDSVS